MAELKAPTKSPPSPPIGESDSRRSGADRLAEWIGNRETPQDQTSSKRASVRERWSDVTKVTASWFGWLQSPLAVAWTAAGIVTLTVIVWMLKDYAEWSRASQASRPRATEDPNVTAVNDLPSPHSLEQQLADLAERLERFHARYERFPRGRVSDDDDSARFGWLAELEAEFPSTSRPGPTPLWDLGWRDPLNDGFVRRRLPAVINPLADQQVGEDGYPTTHFVGVAGLGADGPTLPADHPRAGIFGYDRVTRPEDVEDGLSNTIMIAGVETGLGSWADADSSIRPFTEAPYINGPDGFGTGQPDGMFVLMADGSVKFISDQVDPVVIRRMTAMSDGFSLDPDEPGDPLDLEPPATIVENDPPVNGDGELTPSGDTTSSDPPEVAVEARPALDEPIEVPIAVDEPDPPRFFIERSLQVSLRRFDQPPVELRQALLTLEELIGSPFAWNVPETDEWDGILEREVAVSQENTTVDAVLSEVLTSVGLKYRLEDEGIYIEPQ